MPAPLATQRVPLKNGAVFNDGIRPRILAINPQPTRNTVSGSRTASELSAKTELARLITAENDHVDLIGGGMELDAQASARHLEKRGVDLAFYPHQPHYDMVPNTYSCPASQLLFDETTNRAGWRRHCSAMSPP